GSGIPSDAREHLFEPFWSRRREGRGSGLGLAVVYSLVQQAGGRVLVDSAPGQGTCMTIRLPLAGGGTADGLEDAGEGEAGLRVLLVDPDGRRAAVRMEALAGEGIEPRHAPSVEEASELAGSWRPSVLVTASEALPDGEASGLPGGVPVVVVGEARGEWGGAVAAVVPRSVAPSELARILREVGGRG
ncbi:MAG TPA: ATP-binding protein, partial [Acidobacteria bacterium]|nr:ATP-binding protein [Acidobacteriota bacterium]